MLCVATAINVGDVGWNGGELRLGKIAIEHTNLISIEANTPTGRMQRNRNHYFVHAQPSTNIDVH